MFEFRARLGTNVLATSSRNVERANSLVSELHALIIMVREQTSSSRDAISRIDSKDRQEKPLEPPPRPGVSPR
jgi:hypothetical protein